MSKVLTLLEILLTNEGANILFGYGWDGAHRLLTRSKVASNALYFSPLLQAAEQAFTFRGRYLYYNFALAIFIFQCWQPGVTFT